MKAATLKQSLSYGVIVASLLVLANCGKEIESETYEEEASSPTQPLTVDNVRVDAACASEYLGNLDSCSTYQLKSSTGDASTLSLLQNDCTGHALSGNNQWSSVGSCPSANTLNSRYCEINYDKFVERYYIYGEEILSVMQSDCQSYGGVLK